MAPQNYAVHHAVHELWVWHLSPTSILYRSGALLLCLKGVHTRTQDLTYLY